MLQNYDKYKFLVVLNVKSDENTWFRVDAPLIQRYIVIGEAE